jgi:hypothetical protein
MREHASLLFAALNAVRIVPIMTPLSGSFGALAPQTIDKLDPVES